MNFKQTVIVGLLARLLLIPFFAQPYDSFVLYTVGSEAVARGPLNVNYFSPVLLYILVPITQAYGVLAPTLGARTIEVSSLPRGVNPYPQLPFTVIPDSLFLALTKSVFVISDLAIAILVYRMVKGRTDSLSLMKLWWLNPYVIWMSAGWGAFDSMAVALTLLTLYLLSRGDIPWAGLSLAFASGLKIYPLIMIFPYLLYLRDHGWRRLLQFLAPLGITLVLLIVPAMNSVAGAIGFLTVADPGRFGFGLTYWSLALAMPLPKQFAIYSSMVLTVLLVSLTYFLVSKLSKPWSYPRLAAALVSPILAFFLGYRIIPEPFYLWVLPFVILLAYHGYCETSLIKLASWISLIYSIVNLPLPFFMLPSYSWAAPLIQMALSGLGVDPTRAGEYAPHPSVSSISLAVLGATASITFGVLYFEVLLRPARKIIHQFLMYLRLGRTTA